MPRLPAAEPDCFFQRPGSVGVERDSRLRETFRKRSDGLHLLRAGEHSTFQFEVLESVSRFGGFGQLQNRLCRERLFMSQSEPFVIRRLVALIGQSRSSFCLQQRRDTPAPRRRCAVVPRPVTRPRERPETDPGDRATRIQLP